MSQKYVSFGLGVGEELVPAILVSHLMTNAKTSCNCYLLYHVSRR